MAFDRLQHLDPVIVMGIDPGTQVMGFGVVGRRAGQLVPVDHGAFRAPRSGDISERLSALFANLESALEHHRPHVISLEEAFFAITEPDAEEA